MSSVITNLRHLSEKVGWQIPLSILVSGVILSLNYAFWYRKGGQAQLQQWHSWWLKNAVFYPPWLQSKLPQFSDHFTVIVDSSVTPYDLRTTWEVIGNTLAKHEPSLTPNLHKSITFANIPIVSSSVHAETNESNDEISNLIKSLDDKGLVADLDWEMFTDKKNNNVLRPVLTIHIHRKYHQYSPTLSSENLNPESESYDDIEQE